MILRIGKNIAGVFHKRRRTCHNRRVAKTEDELPWDAELVRRVGEAAKTARGGKSAAWLSAETDRLGYKLSTSVIAKLDSGHRGSVLSVPELLILAAALEVPPLALLFPKLPDGPVETIPNQPQSSFDAYLWAAGLPPSPQRSDLAQLLGYVRERWETIKELARLRVRVSTASDAMSKKGYEALRAAAVADLARLNSLIPAVGGVLNAETADAAG